MIHQRTVLFSGLILATLFVLAIGKAGVVLGMSLEEAKDQGLVGEQLNGYLGIVGASQTQKVQSLVNEINQQRREKYQEIAVRNTTNLEAVELLAGKTAVQKTQSGHYIQSPFGDWVKK